MAINLLNITPHQVSRDLSGYILFLYGPAKVGKTTFGVKMPKSLILAFERGYNAIPGAMVQDITTWGEMKTVLRELKKPEVKDTFKSIIVDTADIAADMCQKYICNQLGIDNIGDGGWTNNGWAKYKKEFEETFRSLAQLGYAVVFISHDKEKTIKPQNGSEYQQIGSSMQSSALSVIENMADIIGYAHPKQLPDGSFNRVLTLRSLDNSIRCGCRFPYIQPEVDFSYEALTKALNDAIDKASENDGAQFITSERQTITEAPTFDYEKLIAEFQELAGKIMTAPNATTNGAKITAIVSKYLGKNKKIAETTPEQAELVSLIVDEIKDTIQL